MSSLLCPIREQDATSCYISNTVLCTHWLHVHIIDKFVMGQCDNLAKSFLDITFQTYDNSVTFLNFATWHFLIL